ncbi:GIY-YIG nuclease family protein [Echinimonas agarilytica]|uniref:GIY-YIG nuclease family protein n=1 Tax=Echinimonas agarilytica TaxID=1215918 RepID=A0AA41W689_9GAMM|nr:GIY-YIG nuclease family protein [Echinimonas agarilytica]MCM2679398.1 GIY-YIG nuclease family protein [Echinimonas agarilytica]
MVSFSTRTLRFMNKTQTAWYVYIIQTHKGALYTGITKDVERRFKEHLEVSLGIANAKGAKYFRTNKPCKIVYQEALVDRSQASKAEYKIKQMTRAKKLRLIDSK